MIFRRLVVGPYEVNCYIVGSEDTKEGLVIDPGDDAPGILKNVKALGLNIRLIVITHSHIDHIDAIQPVREATGAGLAIHADDAPLLRAQGHLFSGTSPLASARLLKGEDSIDVADLHFQVLHTPGHSPGGICLLGHGLVFTGDTLFNYSIGRTDFPSGSYEDLMDSIHTKLMVLPDDTLVYPGHGPDSTIGNERRFNPFLR
ncbi:MAG: MBL fold metallo-hydrolase [Chloroflexi bacterium]|nr:MBL fold metallo-hydrolase [Chloroflexota bacterium]